MGFIKQTILFIARLLLFFPLIMIVNTKIGMVAESLEKMEHPRFGWGQY